MAATTLAACAAVRQFLARARLSAIGFSQSTALPARTLARRCVSWTSVDDPITTACTCGSSSISSTEVENLAPCAAARALPAFASMSTTQCRVVSGCSAMLRAWMRPIVPAPIRANPILLILATRRTPLHGGLHAVFDHADNFVGIALPPVALRKDLDFDISAV